MNLKEMNAIQKKVLMLVLSLSNLAILGLVFNTYFSNQQSLLLFSTTENRDDLNEKINKDCEEDLKALSQGERNHFICNVDVDRRQHEAFYNLRTRLTVTRQEDGSLSIQGQGAMRDKTQHATEADFCNDCDIEKITLQEGTLEELMMQVKDTAGKFYTKAEDAVHQARQKYNERDREKRMAYIRERKCEGKWNESSKSFEKFDTEEKLDCKMVRISELGLPLEIESFYHEELKNELWKIAISDDDYILNNELLNTFGNPYRYPLSVRSSSNLLKHYLSWKDEYSSLDSSSKIPFLQNLKGSVTQMTSFMTKEQSQKDLYYINKGFDGLFARLNQTTTLQNNTIPNNTTPNATTPNASPTPAINYDDVKSQTQGLYK